MTLCDALKAYAGPSLICGGTEIDHSCGPLHSSVFLTEVYSQGAKVRMLKDGLLWLLIVVAIS